MRPPYQNQHQYAFDQEVQRHDDAVHWFGEMTAFILWWHVHDFEAGRVGRCTECYVPLGDITDVFKQTPIQKCPNCYGTTFDGGIRAILYRPAIWSTGVIDGKVHRRGEVSLDSGSIQMVSSFVARGGDVAVRPDGTRWRLSQVNGPELSTGFGPRPNVDATIRSVGSVTLDEETSVSYMVDIELDALLVSGWVPYQIHSPHPNDVLVGPELVSP